MDIALGIEKLVPSAIYRGSVTANTRQAFDQIRWLDQRAKPTWDQIVVADADVVRETNERRDQLDQKKVALKAKLNLNDDEILTFKELIFPST